MASAEKPAAQPTELFRLLGELEMKGTLAEAQRRYGLGQGEFFKSTSWVLLLASLTNT